MKSNTRQMVDLTKTVLATDNKVADLEGRVGLTEATIVKQAAALSVTQSKVKALDQRVAGLENSITRITADSHGSKARFEKLTEVQRQTIIRAAEQELRL